MALADICKSNPISHSFSKFSLNKKNDENYPENTVWRVWFGYTTPELNHLIFGEKKEIKFFFLLKVQAKEMDSKSSKPNHMMYTLNIFSLLLLGEEGLMRCAWLWQ